MRYVLDEKPEFDSYVFTTFPLQAEWTPRPQIDKIQSLRSTTFDPARKTISLLPKRM
jgi:hypothetical protein